MPYQITLPDGSIGLIDDSVPRDRAMEAAEAAYPDAFPGIGEQLLGAPKELLKGLGRGFVDPATGLFSTLYTGARAAGVEMAPFEETGVGRGLAEIQESLAPGYGTISEFTGAVGGLGSFLIPGTLLAKGLGRAATLGGMATGLGAEEARGRVQQARAEGIEVSPEQEFVSQLGGTAIGLTELAPIERLTGPLQAVLRGVKKSDADMIAPGLFNSAKRMLETGGIEGLQEGMANVAQDLLAKGVYNPNLAVGDSAMGDAAMGASVGAFAQGAIELLTKGRRRALYDQLKTEEEAKKAAAEAEKARIAEEQERKRIREASPFADQATILALPAPQAQTTLTAKEKATLEQKGTLDPDYDAIYQPIQPFTRAELGAFDPAVVKELDKRRDEAGRPKTETFTVQDLADTGILRGEINRLIAQRSGYTGETTFKPSEVISLARSKNIDTQTQGFSDFIGRVTGRTPLPEASGINALRGLNDVEMFAVRQAINNMPTYEQTKILPTGKSAKIFDGKQATRTLTNLKKTLSEDLGAEGLGESSVLKEIGDFSGLTDIGDQKSLLQKYIDNGDLERVSTPAFGIIDANGNQVGFVKAKDGQLTQAERNEAREKANKIGGTVKDITINQIRTPDPVAKLIQGVDIREGQFETDVVEGFDVVTETGEIIGKTKTEEAAQARVQRANEVRAKAQQEAIALKQKIEDDILVGEQALMDMESIGRKDSEQYNKVAENLNTLKNRLIKTEQRIADLGKGVDYKQRNAKKQKSGFTLFEGNVPIGTYPTRNDAFAASVVRLSDSQLEGILDAFPTLDAGPGTGAEKAQVRRIQQLAATELASRKGEVPRGIGVDVQGDIQAAEERLAVQGIFSPRIKERVNELEKKLRAALDKLGLKDVRLNIVAALRSPVGSADGVYAARLIKIALDAENPMRALRHEGIHALKELGAFTPEQWRALESRARKEWMQKYDIAGRYKGLNLDQDSLLEEAISDAFSDFSQTKPPAGLIGNIFNRIKQFFARLDGVFKGEGFQTADDVFAGIEQGRIRPGMGVRAGQVAGLRAQRVSAEVPERYQLRDPFKDARIASAGEFNQIQPPQSLIDLAQRVQETDANATYPAAKTAATKLGRRLNKEMEDFARQALGREPTDADISNLSSRLSQFTDEDLRDYIAETAIQPQERYSLREPAKVIYEVAPDPNNVELTERWNALPTEQKTEISKRVGARIVEAALPIIGARGRVADQVGSYLEFTNPSFALVLEDGDPIEMSKLLGFALSQDSMMVVSGDQAPGLDPTGGIVIDIGEVPFDQIDAIYQQLREIEVNGEKPVGGQTTVDGKMIVLNYSGLPSSDLANLIDQRLGGQFDVSTGNFFTAFPEKGEYDYASPSDDPTGSAGLIRKRSRDLRTEASRLLNDEINAVPKFSLRTPSTAVNILNGSETKPDLGKKPTVQKVGEYFDRLVQDEFGRKLDYSNGEDFARAIEIANAEVEYQLQQEKSGLDWYDEDIKKAFKETIRVIPELRTAQKRHLFSIVAGIMSPQTNARDNWFIAGQAFKHYVDTGEIPGLNPETGGLWMGGTTSKNKKVQLDFLNRMVEDMGEKKAVQWLLSDHPVKEINGFRQKYGNIKSGIGGKMDDIVPGLYAFGPKVGPFVSNINGIHDVTVDLWMTRTFNRYFGTMIGPDGKISDAPTEPQRRAIKRFINEVAQNANIKPYQAQSVLWFFEQKLYRELGTPAPSFGFSDGARKLSGRYPATGDRGGEAGIQADARPDGKFSLRTTNTPEFKQWFGRSQIVDEQGRPRVMYHGTARDITEFKPKQAGAIFVTDDPRFAEDFSYMSEMWMIDHATQFLSDQEIKKAVAAGVAKMGKGVPKQDQIRMLTELLKFPIESIVQDPDAVDIRNEIAKRLPSKPNILPVYVRAEKPFDFENPEHLADLQSMQVNPTQLNRVRRGEWSAIEDPEVQTALQDLGFDSFYVKEGGKKNLAVYNPNQLKSVTGNIGTYGQREPTETEAKQFGLTVEEARAAQKRGDIRYSLRQTNTPEFKRWFKDSKVVDEEGNPRVVYHGTDKTFNAFNPRKLGARQNVFDEGFYFSDRPETGSSYALMSVYTGALGRDRGAYLEPKKTFDRFLNRLGLKESAPQVVPVFLSIQNPYIYTRGETPRLSRKSLLERGYDGIEYKQDDGSTYWVALKPTQIKSAIGNIGTFDPTKPDIRYSLRDFKLSDLPTENKDTAVYTLPEGIKIFHGSNKDTAAEIKKAGYVLLSSPPYKSSGGYNTEGGLVWFGDKETADFFATGPEGRAFEDQKEPGEVFETITDEPLRLVHLTEYKLSADQAKKINDFYEMPDYKLFKEGDSLNTISWRVTSNTNALRKTKSYRIEGTGTMYSVLKDVARLLGFDGYYYDNGIAIPVETGIRLGLTEEGKFVGKPMERFSLRQRAETALGPGYLDAVNRTTTPQVEKGFFERMGEAISPTSVSRFRQMFINKYEAIEVYSKELAKKFGNGVLLADTSAIAAALMSDRAAGVAAESFKSGIPVYNKGYTYVDNMGGKVKGLMEVLMPLAQYKDPLVYRMFQNYAAMRRGVRLNAEGKMTPFTTAELAQLPKIEKEFPEFKQVFADYQTYNEGLVRYMRDTGVISAEDAKNYMKYGDYIPFYRQLEGERTIGPNIFSAISGVKAPKKLKGGDAPLGEFLETVVRNSKAAIEAGMRNVAANRVVTQFQALNSPSGRGNLVERTTEADRGSPDVVVVRENGKDAFYKVADPLLVQSLQALNIPQIPGLDILAKPATFLREMVTRDPAFIGASVLRESLSAWITTGQRLTPVASGVNQFVKILANASPEVEALRKAGIGSGYEFKGDVQSTAGEFSKQLKAKAGDMTTAQKSVMPLMKMWDALDRGSTAADLSTRTAVFKRVMEETGNEAEAIYQAMEVINFSRKGSSPIVQIFSAIIPFLNARIQGLDLLYRAGFGRLASASAVTQQKAFMLRSLALLGSTAMYYALVQDDEEWQRADQETRDNYWILGGFKFPIPFELGVMFKVIPERIMAYTMGDDTGQQVIDSIQRQLTGTLAFNPIPQAVLPLVETSANYSFFLQRDIVGMGKKDLAPEYQISEGTSQVAIQLGQTLGISPMKIDYVLRGYTGAMGTYAITAMDSIIRGEDDASKATWRLDQIPVLKRFMISDLGAGTVNDYYDLREKLDEVVRTTNQLERTGNIDALQEYLKDNGQVLGMKDYIRALDKDMKAIRESRLAINISRMEPDQKREALDALRRAEISLTERIGLLRKNMGV